MHTWLYVVKSLTMRKCIPARLDAQLIRGVILENPPGAAPDTLRSHVHFRLCVARLAQVCLHGLALARPARRDNMHQYNIMALVKKRPSRYLRYFRSRLYNMSYVVEQAQGFRRSEYELKHRLIAEMAVIHACRRKPTPCAHILVVHVKMRCDALVDARVHALA